jgi:hypothetical protein
VVQALPSVHAVPLATFEIVQPDAGLQPSVVHWLPSSQMMPLPVQAPETHWSPLLQALPSLQGRPFATGVTEQPVAGLQVSTVHALLSLHVTGEPVHVPAWHWSAVVQRLPSLQTVPLATGVTPQPVTGLQLSVVQALLSLQVTGVPPQAPAVH